MSQSSIILQYIQLSSKLSSFYPDSSFRIPLWNKTWLKYWGWPNTETDRFALLILPWHIYMCSALYCLLVTQMERIFCTTAWKREIYWGTSWLSSWECSHRLSLYCVNNSQLPSESVGVKMNHNHISLHCLLITQWRLILQLINL